MASISRTQKVQRWLQKNKGKWLVIAADSGVAYTTVKNIGSGIVKNPWANNIDRLYAVMEKAA